MESCSKQAVPDVFGSIAQLATSVLRAQVKLGEDLVRLASSTPIPKLADLTSGCSCGSCTIPPPCWVPKSLGEVTSVANECGTPAKLCLRLRNCDFVSRRFQVAVQPGEAGASPPLPEVVPPELDVAGLAGGKIVLRSAPGDAASPAEAEYLVIIRGCLTYYLRWKIVRTSILASSTQEVHIRDCPDLVHHWYDHFYCARSCKHGSDASLRTSHR
jgi:hypothetical protein